MCRSYVNGGGILYAQKATGTPGVPVVQMALCCIMLYYAVLCFFDVVNKPFADLAGAVCFGAVGCDVLGYYSSIH